MPSKFPNPYCLRIILNRVLNKTPPAIICFEDYLSLLLLDTPRPIAMTASLLPSLPVELLLEIQANLSYGSRIALLSTCRELYHKIHDPGRRTNGAQTSHTNLAKTIEKGYGMRDLLEIEMWPEYHSARDRPAESRQPIPSVDFFACYLCRKIRCASKFSNAMMKGKRGKLGNGSVAEKSGRFCISCGIRVGIYKRGDWLQYGGALGSCAFVCRDCGSFIPAGLLSMSVGGSI